MEGHFGSAAPVAPGVLISGLVGRSAGRAKVRRAATGNGSSVHEPNPEVKCAKLRHGTRVHRG